MSEDDVVLGGLRYVFKIESRDNASEVGLERFSIESEDGAARLEYKMLSIESEDDAVLSGLPDAF